MESTAWLRQKINKLSISSQHVYGPSKSNFFPSTLLKQYPAVVFSSCVVISLNSRITLRPPNNLQSGLYHILLHQRMGRYHAHMLTNGAALTCLVKCRSRPSSSKEEME